MFSKCPAVEEEEKHRQGDGRRGVETFCWKAGRGLRREGKGCLGQLCVGGSPWGEDAAALVYGADKQRKGASKAMRESRSDTEWKDLPEKEA